MQQLDKWQQELERLSHRSYRQTGDQVRKIYKQTLKDMKTRLTDYVANYDQLSFSKKLEVERLFNVAGEMDQILKAPYESIDSAVKAGVANQAEQGYYGAWYALEQANNIELQMGLLDPELIVQAVNRPVAGARLSTRLYRQRNKLAKAATTEIVNGLFSGESYAQISKRLSDYTEADYKRALRIVQTESGRVRSETTQIGYQKAEKLGVGMQKRWLATLDGKTRHDHRYLDGQTVDVDEDFHDSGGHTASGPRLFGIAREDVNCRCTTIAVVDGIEPELRRNNETGKNEKYRTYAEWRAGKEHEVVGFAPIEAENSGLFSRKRRDYNLSAAEAKKRMLDEFGIRTKETSRTKLDEVAMNQVYSTFKRFENLYKALPDPIPAIRAMPKSEGKQAIAVYVSFVKGHKPVEIGINVGYFKTAADLENLSKRSVASGWFSKNAGPDHILLHEFSHHLDGQLSNVAGFTFSDRVFQKLDSGYDGKYTYLKVSSQIGGYADSFYRRRGRLSEGFAELFSEAYGDTPRQIAIDFRTEFEKLAEEVLKNAN